MSVPRIAILDASHGDRNTKRNFRRELDASLTEFDVTDGQLPDTFAFDAAVVTGSRSSVYWDEPWIDPTKAWIGEAIERELPFLGICYGHQLLADVLGGTVEGMGEYEIGYNAISLTGDSRLFDGVDEEFLAFTTHSDAVVELPPGAEPLAENEYSNHGFRKGHVFGVQFHPEYDMDTAAQLTRRKDLSAERRSAVLDGITEENYAAACEAKLVFENFLGYVEGVTETPVAAD
ncbi:type 1 glutamine amidotransferase [Halalkalicoccus jeotgali]|uniref:Glutamine amidotransferase class-I n=1 Tax=Halalkalicoccus jeotgali (strain DSM 18796 / CECT 7217 / JCM 14584 / KCTC 4019 / B3) TaxID=795797 RepID=D8J550_HALJB|nr:type 1 glutamine amidotransferase [Halalkalicoccus jeotgali]ADJ13631.1 glutamine amidotransferase class-I [Halalkalicoccus jeotgali B3]ELY33347.1 glutamine amidotransferase class-I [Halalkalicoccus jeotgali B3]